MYVRTTMTSFADIDALKYYVGQWDGSTWSVEECDDSVHPMDMLMTDAPAKLKRSLYVSKEITGKPNEEENEFFKRCRSFSYWNYKLNGITWWILMHNLIREPAIMSVQLKLEKQQRRQRLNVFFHPDCTAEDVEGVSRQFPDLTGKAERPLPENRGARRRQPGAYSVANNFSSQTVKCL